MNSNITETKLINGFLWTYPKKEVIKRTAGEKIHFKCELAEELLKEKIIVEVWTNISGRYHGYEMNLNDNFFSLELDCKKTGFYSATFRWRHDKHEYWNWLFSPDEKDFTQIHVDPEYIDESIVYNAFIRFFGYKDVEKNGRINIKHTGSFDDLKYRLDELKKMGIKILYLNPIHPIGELYRNYNPHDLFPPYMQPGCPYSIRDYKAIDPELAIDKDHSQGPYASLSEPMKEFKEMVKEAHKRGIKVYMDLVFNHTSHDFVLQRLHPEWFLYKEDIKSLDAPYLYPEDAKKGKPWGDARFTMCPFDHGFWWEDAAQLNWNYKIPEAINKPPKNPTIKEMYTYFKSIPKYWIKHIGIDGFRCDVAYRIPLDFWRECIHEAREFAKKEHPKNGSITGDVVFIAESYIDDIKELFEAGFTAVYGDFSNKLYTVETLKGYLDYMYNISGKFFPENARFFIFPECHDFVRNTKKLLGQLSKDEILSERANKSRWTITATLPGIPMIFNGFEKLEWQQINLFSYSSIDWESDKDLKKYITKVNNIRNKYKALQKGKYIYVKTNQGINQYSQLFSFMRIYDKQKMLVCVNMDLYNRATVKIYLDESGIDFTKKYTLKDLLTNKKYLREGKEVLIVLEPGESHIFEIIQ
ncbi:MAG: alpha-amylase family glycosyl hydrolase [Candidatus Woesearchaeota archaeon]